MPLPDTEKARFNMIEQQVRPWQVSDFRVLELLASVKRENFVPIAYKALAFADLEIALPGGQQMLSPKVQARLLQDARVQSTDKVLEIGTGSGYMTALLASMARHVLSLEIVPELVEMAQAHLQNARIHNAEVRLADGALGAAVDAPFDLIVLGGSVAEVPSSLLSQLRLKGRLVAIVGDEPIMHAQTITRMSDTHYQIDIKWDFTAPRLQNFLEPSHFKF